MANYAPEQLADWEREGGQRLDYYRGLIIISSEAEHDHLINLPNRFVVVEATKEGISAVKDIQRYFEKLATDYPDHVFAQFASEKVPSLAARMNIFPTFRFYLNGQMLHQCYGGNEVSLKTNFDRALAMYKKIMNPPKKKDLGSPEDLTSFGRKVVTARGDRDETWVPENLRVAALPQRAVDEEFNISPRGPKATTYVNVNMDEYTRPAPDVQAPKPRIAAPPTFLPPPKRIEEDVYTLQRTQSTSPVQHQQVQAQYQQQPMYHQQSQQTIVSPRPHAVSTGITFNNSGGTFALSMAGASVGSTPTQVDLPRLATICPGGEFVWALDVNGGVWRWNGSSFERIPGKLRSLAVGSDGAVWGTDYQDNIYRRTQNGWQQVRGRLHSVHVGNQNNVWGIQPDGTTVKYLGGGQWQPITSFILPQ